MQIEGEDFEDEFLLSSLSKGVIVSLPKREICVQDIYIWNIPAPVIFILQTESSFDLVSSYQP
jgi:hypothetical protein